MSPSTSSQLSKPATSKVCNASNALQLTKDVRARRNLVVGPSTSKKSRRSRRKVFRLLALPLEVRNLIYRYMWMGARKHDWTWDIPDFIISVRGLRWKNIKPLRLLLVSKGICREAMMAIRGLTYFEIEVSSLGNKWALPQESLAVMNSPLCHSVQKITLDMRDREWFLGGYVADIFSGVLVEMMDYKFLKEVVIKLDVTEWTPRMLRPLAHFFWLAEERKHIIFVLELLHGDVMRCSKKDWIDGIKLTQKKHAYDVDDVEFWIDWVRYKEPKPLSLWARCRGSY